MEISNHIRMKTLLLCMFINLCNCAHSTANCQMAVEEGCVGSPVYVDTHNGQCLWCVNGTHYCECWRVDETTNTTSRSLNASLCTGKPPKLELHGGDCVSHCTSSSYQWLDRCLESCPDGTVIWNTTVCLERCPAGLFARQQSPATSHSNQICDRSCPDDQWKYAGRCVAQCPGDAQYMLADKHQCIERCPVEYFVLGLYCLPCHESCLDTAGCSGPTPDDCKMCFAQIHKTWIPSTCLERCPDATPYYNQIQDDITLYRCESVCSWPRVQSQIGMGRIACVDFCPPNQTYVINKVCTDETTCPVDYPYHYQRHNMTECSVECPASHYYLPGHLCADRCRAPFAYHWQNYCLNRCPEVAKYYDASSRECLIQCTLHNISQCVPICPVETPNYFNELCVAECPDSAQYQLSSDPRCYEKCPSGSAHMPLSTECLTRCSDPLPINNNGYCATACSEGRYLYKDACYKVCPDGSSGYRDNVSGVDICADVCPEPMPFQYGHVCQRHCPESAKFHVNSDNRSTCCKTCPNSAKYYLIDKWECLESCPENADKTCRIKYCPDDDIYCIKIYYVIPGGFVGCRCVSSCPDKMVNVRQTLTCEDNCPTTMSYVSRHTCVERCPATELYVQATVIYGQNLHKCLSHCLDATVHDIGSYECFSKCPSERRPYVYDSTCMDRCPSGYLHLRASRAGTLCLSVCPDNTVSALNTTSMSLPGHNTSVDQYNCLDHCPSGLPWRYESTCILVCPNNTFEHRKYCLPSCPGKTVAFVNDTTNIGMCLDQCPSEWLLVSPDTTCLRMCPNYTYLYKNSCLSACPHNMVSFFNETTDKGYCLMQCPLDYPFLDNARCLSQCPTTSRFYVSIEGRFNCVDNCPWRTVYVLGEHECLDKCPNATDHGVKCHSRCPADQPYQHCVRPYYRAKESCSCVANCSGMFLIESTMTCVEECPSDLSYSVDGVCRNNCSVDKPLIGRQRYTSKSTKECVSSCRNNEYVIEDKMACSDQCPENRNFAVDGVCRSNCSNTKPFVQREYTEPITKTCIEACSSLDVHADDEMVCLRSCPQHKPYKILKVCYSVCPEGYTNGTGYNSKRCIPTTNILNAIRKSYGGVVCMVIFFAQLFATIWCVRKSSKKISEAERRRLMESLICRNANQ